MHTTIESFYLIVPPLLTKHDNLELPVGGNNSNPRAKLTCA